MTDDSFERYEFPDWTACEECHETGLYFERISTIGPFEIDGITYDRTANGDRIPGLMISIKLEGETEECHCDRFVSLTPGDYASWELEDLEYI